MCMCLVVSINGSVTVFIFAINDFNFAWDGTYKGILQEPSVFVYYIDLVFIDDYRLTGNKGSITLIR